MAERLHRPKAKRFWFLVRRLLLRRGHRPAPGEDAEGEKSGLLGRSSLEQLLVTDSAAGAGAPGDGDACPCATKKHGQPVGVLLPALLARPESAATEMSVAEAGAGAGRGGAPVQQQHRRFMFGGFRRRLLMRRPWRPVLVAIPE